MIRAKQNDKSKISNNNKKVKTIPPRDCVGITLGMFFLYVESKA